MKASRQLCAGAKRPSDWWMDRALQHISQSVSSFSRRHTDTSVNPLSVIRCQWTCCVCEQVSDKHTATSISLAWSCQLWHVIVRHTHVQRFTVLHSMYPIFTSITCLLSQIYESQQLLMRSSAELIVALINSSSSCCCACGHMLHEFAENGAKMCLLEAGNVQKDERVYIAKLRGTFCPFGSSTLLFRPKKKERKKNDAGSTLSRLRDNVHSLEARERKGRVDKVT